MTLAEILELNDLTPESYSGRGMYGKECLAFRVENELELIQSCVEIGMSAAEDEEDIETVRKAFAGVRTDQLGHGLIVYFPRTPYEKE